MLWAAMRSPDFDDPLPQLVQREGIRIKPVDLSRQFGFAPPLQPLRKIIGTPVQAEPRLQKVKVERNVRDPMQLGEKVRYIGGNQTERHDETLGFAEMELVAGRAFPQTAPALSKPLFDQR